MTPVSVFPDGRFGTGIAHRSGARWRSGHWAGWAVLAAAAALHPAFAADSADFKPAPANVDRVAMATAREAIAARQWGLAIDRLQSVVAKTPDHADAHMLLGYCYRWQGRMDDAFASYGRALQLSPDHRGAHEYVGVAYLTVGQPAEAQAHLDQLLRICGTDCAEYKSLQARITDAAKAKS